jgi:hypothetical protein
MSVYYIQNDPDYTLLSGLQINYRIAIEGLSLGAHRLSKLLSSCLGFQFDFGITGPAAGSKISIVHELIEDI